MFIFEPVSIFKVNAPALLWVVSLLILGVGVFLALQLRRKINSIKKEYKTIDSALIEIGRSIATKHRQGISLHDLERIEAAFGSSKLRIFWDHYRTELLESRDIDSGQDCFYASKSVSDFFHKSDVLDQYKFNADWYKSMPGIITAFGLMITFIAILFALRSLSVDGSKVNGIDELIRGLSGKFISSVSALATSIVYTLIEKHLFHSLDKTHLSLIKTIDNMLPRLSAEQLLFDVNSKMEKQTLKFDNFDTHLAPLLRKSFSEGLGEGVNPTLTRMATVIDDLNTNLRQQESNKSESITSSVAGLLNEMKTSITDALQNMGEKFTDSLSGSTAPQFQSLLDSLKINAESMVSTRGDFNNLIKYAKDSAEQQMTSGRSQVEELTGVLKSVISQMNETAGSSATQVSSILTSVVTDLSQKVSDLSFNMGKAVSESTERAAGTLGSLVEKTGQLSNQTANQLARLLEKYEINLEQVQQLRSVLDQALGKYKETLDQSAVTVGNLKDSTQNTQISVQLIGDSVKSLRDIQASVQGLVVIMGESATKFNLISEMQQSSWERIRDVMDKYATTFDMVEGKAENVVKTINTNLLDYIKTVQGGMDKVIEMANNEFANASKSLGDSVSDLDEALEKLSNTIKVRVNVSA